MTKERFCPKCRGKRPMMKAGKAVRANGDKQLWKCRHKPCSYVTVNPIMEKL